MYYRAAAMIAGRSSSGLLVATCAAGGVGAVGCLVLLAAPVDRDRAGGAITTTTAAAAAALATSSTAAALATSSTAAALATSSTAAALATSSATKTTTTSPLAAFASSSSSSSSSPSSPLRDLLDDLEARRSLIVPAAEALLRAARLVGTAAVMAADYRLDLAMRRHPIAPAAAIARALGSIVGDGEEEEEEDRRRIAIELEGRIERLERDLVGAQGAYAESKSPPRGGRVDRRTDDGVEEDAADRPNELALLAKRHEKEAMLSIAGDLAAAREELSSLLSAPGGGDGDGGIIGGSVHARNARRLLDLCRANGGVYVKVGQHLANLDLLLPAEYVDALSSLFDDAPVSSYDDVRRVVIEELGSDPDELYANFSRMPFASASLAQVHEASCRATGNRLAIKVQHRGLRETSRGDLLAMAAVVGVAESLFDDFNFGWICEELTPQVRGPGNDTT